MTVGSQLSIAVGMPMDTNIEHGEGPEAVTVISTGPLEITGGILSTTDIICMQLELLPQSSIAINVR